MGISLYSALAIQGNGDDIVCEPYGQHKETHKWAGAINLYKDGFFHTTLLSSEPVYDTRELAIEGMKEVVEAVRAMDLSPKKKQLEETVGEENMGVVKTVLEAAQG